MNLAITSADAAHTPAMPAMVAQVENASPSKGQPVQALTPRLLLGLVGVLVATLAAGFNGNVTDIAMHDLSGVMSFGRDQGSFLTTLYQATQVAAMAFAPWCAVTWSLRRFTLAAVSSLMLLGALSPFATNFSLLLTLHTLQGLAAGCLPPVLMTAALRFLPPKFRLYGLAGYAVTATFGPNLAIPLAALWTDYVGWQFVFWQVVPLCLLSLFAVFYGIPQDPMRLERLARFDWIGLLTGFPGLCFLVVAILQGDRLDWLSSPLIVSLLLSSSILLTTFFINEYFHPAPFFSLDILKRRNFTHALFTLAGLLIVLSAMMIVPSSYLASIQGYRPLQTAPIALLVALPQIVTLPLIAAVCNRPWVDCRWVMAIGLGLCAWSLWHASHITGAWSRENFYGLMALQSIGQPMAVVALLMSSTSVVAPSEGPVASAWFNTIKAFAAVAASGIVTALATTRGQFHFYALMDQIGNSQMSDVTVQGSALASLGQQVAQQAQVLASADIDRYMTVLAIALMILIPFATTRVFPPAPARVVN